MLILNLPIECPHFAILPDIEGGGQIPSQLRCMVEYTLGGTKLLEVGYIYIDLSGYMRPVLYYQALARESMIKRNTSK